MARVKRGTIKNKTRRNILKKTKGYIFGRSKKERQAREAIMHAGMHAFAHRRDKKNDRRRLWQIKINAVARDHGISYSALMGKMKAQNITLDRKILASVAQHHPESFKRILEKVSS